MAYHSHLTINDTIAAIDKLPGMVAQYMSLTGEFLVRVKEYPEGDHYTDDAREAVDIAKANSRWYLTREKEFIAKLLADWEKDPIAKWRATKNPGDPCKGDCRVNGGRCPFDPCCNN
jgi:hypothetical protein